MRSAPASPMQLSRKWSAVSAAFLARTRAKLSAPSSPTLLTRKSSVSKRAVGSSAPARATAPASPSLLSLRSSSASAPLASTAANFAAPCGPMELRLRCRAVSVQLPSSASAMSSAPASLMPLSLRCRATRALLPASARATRSAPWSPIAFSLALRDVTLPPSMATTVLRRLRDANSISEGPLCLSSATRWAPTSDCPSNSLLPQALCLRLPGQEPSAAPGLRPPGLALHACQAQSGEHGSFVGRAWAGVA
mmetsp:Transcript_61415/g.193561  ORF Transcript_61415/g.193561 Transcript_61415/m.193561 type:complete len:251 (+) Transcript_61415:533-1285(+)